MARGPVATSRKAQTLPEEGIRVKIKKKLSTKTGGFLVKQHHIDCRRPNQTGVYLGYVPGAGGDVWWVQHDEDETIGAYLNNEITDVPSKILRNNWKKMFEEKCRQKINLQKRVEELEQKLIDAGIEIPAIKFDVSHGD